MKITKGSKTFHVERFRGMLPRRRPPVRRARLVRHASRKPSGTKDYYIAAIIASDGICEECRQAIPAMEAWRLFAAQAHILPKQIFQSVRTHPDNRLHLCPSCHANWDSSWDMAVTMKVFPLALERFRIFQPLITEISRIPDCFLKPLAI